MKKTPRAIHSYGGDRHVTGRQDSKIGSKLHMLLLNMVEDALNTGVRMGYKEDGRRLPRQVLFGNPPARDRQSQQILGCFTDS